MTALNSTARLKVKRDTFFVPDLKGGVYFRNNVNSFRLEGKSIYQWIEKLLPMFNGEQTLADLTQGLTIPYQERVYEISEMLVENGFVRDLSLDHPHQLDRVILDKFASQIEFIESFTDSAAFRFQQYRQTKPLVIGSGSIVTSLVSSLLESGILYCDVIVKESSSASQEQLLRAVKKVQGTDAEVRIIEGPNQTESLEDLLREVLLSYDWVLYAAEDSNIEQLRVVNRLCKQQGKAFIPAICLENIGLIGPLVIPEEEGCFESAWRRLHRSAVMQSEQLQKFSQTAVSMLVNVAVFEFFKRVTGVADPNQSNQIFLLNPETLEGGWQGFITHPVPEQKEISLKLVEDVEEILDKEVKRNEPPPNILGYFNLLTSDTTGIFHSWEEKNLSQLPLSQCLVQTVDPLSEGPAELLQEVICGGFTHQEAQREAGLTGIEMYVTRWMDSASKIPEGFIGIGTGETVEEALCRGLQACLDDSLRKRKATKSSISYRLKMGRIEDRRCRFYFHALTTLNGVPSIGMEEDLHGFPVIWIRSKGRHYTKAGLNITLALRSALKEALLDAQNKVKVSSQTSPEGAVFLKLNESKLEIPSFEEITQLELLRSSIQVIKQANKLLVVYDLSFEPFLKEELGGVYGVQLQEGET
ncbi:MAG: putative thiazole-containing bacteriocin maturation protein [Bacillota bacterium]|nr:putative thiazole-containing bacteriocin maturation protein [Bacillota bacterium]MDP4154368.1 putative thiazole-containing bacteriocin maturation protein [Bacillota bacterium]